MSGIEASFDQFPQAKDELDLIKLETGSNLKELASELEKAISKYKPLAIIGAITSNSAFVIADISERNKIPFITPFATHSDVTKERKFTFRACFDDSYQAEKLATFAVKNLKKSRIAVVYNSSSSYSLGIKSRFTPIATKSGAKVVAEIGVQNSNNLLPEKIQQIKEANPDLILIPSYQVEAASIISKLGNVLPRTTTYLGPDSWGGGRLFHKVFQGDDIDFHGFYVQHLGGVQLEKRPEFKKILSEKNIFKDKSHQETVAMVAPVVIGYDSGTILFTAYQNSQREKIDLRASIAKLDIVGITGRLNFKSNNTPQKSLFIYKINKKDESFYEEYK